MNCLKCFLNFTEKRIDYAKAEEGLKTTPNSECALNALAIDNPVKYARLYLDGTMQMWIDAEDSLELCYRLRKAALLLTNTEKKVSAISIETGFSNTDYFCKTFKRMYSLTPTEYRNVKK